MANTWCVYIHISPSNKAYVGITHHQNPQLRWGKGGCYYSKRTVFYSAIKKYGWNNFDHIILSYNCSEKAAKILEKILIAYYKSIDMSYNMTIGGDGYNLGKESSTKKYHTEQSKKYREKHPDYEKTQYLKHKDKKLLAARDYYTKNREKVLEYKKTDKVKEKARIRAKKWREEHPEYMKNYMKIYNSKKKKK